MYQDNNTYHVDDICQAIMSESVYRDTAGRTGDFEYIDIIMDADILLRDAGLTERQRYVLDLYYGKGMTLAEIGSELGVTLQAINDSLKQAKRKISKVLERWEDEN